MNVSELLLCSIHVAPLIERWFAEAERLPLVLWRNPKVLPDRQSPGSSPGLPPSGTCLDPLGGIPEATERDALATVTGFSCLGGAAALVRAPHSMLMEALCKQLRPFLNKPTL